MSGKKLVMVMGLFVAVAVTVSVVTVRNRRAAARVLETQVEDRLMRGEARQAVQLIDEAPPGVLEPRWASLHRADGLIQQRAFKDSIAIAEELLAADAGDVQALLVRARSVEGQGYHDEAMKQMDHALELSPRNPDVLAERALVWVSKKDNDRALADLDQAIAANPDHVQALKQRCVIRYQAKQLLEAKKDCEVALRGMPTYHRDRGFVEYAVHEVLEDLERDEDMQNAKFAPPVAAGEDEKKEEE